MGSRKRARPADLLETSEAFIFSESSTSSKPSKILKLSVTSETPELSRAESESNVGLVLLQAPKPGSLSSPLGRLCHRCSSIDLDAIFKRDANRMRPKEDHPVDGVTLNAVDLGAVESWDPTCAFCVHLRSDYRLTSDSIRYKGKYWYLSFSDLQYCRGLQLYCREWGQSPALELPDDSSSGVFIAPVRAIDTRQTVCVVRSEVDFDLISKWLNVCVKEHACHFACEIGKHADRIIDCETRNLVPYNGQDYVALSYVWGKCALPTPEEDSFVRNSMKLPLTIPRAIEDAIFITRRIGKRFLWVDRYCVDQYHSDQKLSQITSMGDIYERATLTIVALVEDANEGIPGVSQKRTEQFLIDSSTMTYTSTCQFMSDVVDRAPYSQRAWTYQEFNLSQSIMVFSKSQVFFRCGQNKFQEGLKMPPSPYGLEFREGTNFLSPTPVTAYAISYKGWKAAYQQTLETLRQSVIDYSQRKMTYGADSLNAFRGILIRSGFKTFYGHPVHLVKDTDDSMTVAQAMQDELAFSRSLLWPALVNQDDKTTKYNSVFQYLEELRSSAASAACRSEYTREPSLPTWSWASSRPISHVWAWGEFDFRSPEFESRYSYCSFPTILVIDEKMREVTLDEFASRHSDHILPETSPRLLFKHAVIVKQLDLFTLAIWVRANSQRNTTPLAPPGFENWKYPDLGLDPSAGPEILEILTGEAQLHAILVDASSTNPRSFYGGSDQYRASSGYLSSSYLEGEVELSFLLVHRKGAQPCKRVGKLKCRLLKSEKPKECVAFCREDVELV